MSTMPEQKPGRSKQDYRTPQDFLTAVRHKLRGDLVHDFAADPTNHVCPYWWGPGGQEGIEDSLQMDEETWAAQVPRGWGWLNPPFADIDPWAERCKWAAKLGAQIALLVPAAVGSNWYRDHVDGHAHVLFLNGRLCFIDDWEHTVDPARLKRAGHPDTFDPKDFYYLSKPLYPKDCMLCLYGLPIRGGTEVWTWNAQR